MSELGQMIAEALPPLEVLKEMEPPEIAAHILETWVNRWPRSAHPIDVVNPIALVDRFGRQDAPPVARLLSEGWAWLAAEGLIAPEPSDISSGHMFITRKGRANANRLQLSEYVAAQLLPAPLDSKLQEKVLPLFHRGDIDVAVFQAFKEVEVRVREAAKLPASVYGTGLMRKAFAPDTGALRDPAAEVPAEREARSNLFTGAIGMFKNPLSHRDFPLTRQNAGRAIALADLLLTIVDAARGSTNE